MDHSTLNPTKTPPTGTSTSQSISSNQSFLNSPNLVLFPSKTFKPNKFVELCLDHQSLKRGRGLYSKYSKTIRPGEPSLTSLFTQSTYPFFVPAKGTTILSLAPHVAVLDTPSLAVRCSSCFLEEEDFEALPDPIVSRQIRRCTKCKVVSYCGEVSLAVHTFGPHDWPAHSSYPLRCDCDIRTAKD